MAHATEALRRCKFKFPGRQYVAVSDKWGFTSIPKPKYVELRDQGKLIVQGLSVQIDKSRGPLKLGSAY